MASAFVPQYAYDLFVSYAHVDDVPHPGNQAGKGWVTTLVDHLKMLLDEKLGRKGSAHVWMDHRLRGHEPFPAEIYEGLKHAATMLVIVSDGYLAADWCHREREAFVNAAGGETEAAGRIFVVYRDEVPRQAVPTAFRDLLGYQFYEKEREGAVVRTLGVPQPDPGERAYYQRLNDLRCDLCTKLKQMRGTPVAQVTGGAAGPATAPAASLTAVPAEAAVFLAEVTPDLVEAREEVGRYLVQEGLHLLPTRYYNRAPRDFSDALDRDLANSVLFAQLLGPYASARTDDIPRGYEGLQLDRAMVASKPVLRWRNRDLNLDTVRDAEQRLLLRGEDVLATDLEEFKRTVAEKAKLLLDKRRLAPPPADVERFVLVNASQGDLPVADELAEELSRLNLGYDIIDESVGLDDLAESEEPDAVVVVYGQCNQNWVQNQVRACRRVMLNKKTRAPVCAVYMAPPEPKEPLRCRPPRMFVVNWKEEVSLRAFLEAVTAERSEE